MEVNIITIFYLFIALAPFILVCFFSLASLFNQDFKGLVYLIGLCFAFGVNILLSVLAPANIISAPDINNTCHSVTIGHFSGLTKLPFSQTIFGYTFAYLFYNIYVNKFILLNIPTMVFFPIIIVSDMWWNINHSCFGLLPLVMSLIVGGLSGGLWAYIVDSNASSSLKYFNNAKTYEVCSQPSKQTFKCNVYRNGVLVTSNIGAKPST
jgi:hypothetical protein